MIGRAIDIRAGDEVEVELHGRYDWHVVEFVRHGEAYPDGRVPVWVELRGYDGPVRFPGHQRLPIRRPPAGMGAAAEPGTTSSSEIRSSEIFS